MVIFWKYKEWSPLPRLSWVPSFAFHAAYDFSPKPLGWSVNPPAATLDGRLVLRHRASGRAADPAAVGREAARYLLDEAGGRSLLAS